MNRSTSRLFDSNVRATRRRRPRRLRAEALENRVLLAADAWHNAANPEDVNGDARTTAQDALLVIRDLNINGPHQVEGAAAASLDVTGDRFVSARDALRVIGKLARAEGEEGDLVRIRLAATPVDSLDPLATLGPNEDFLLRAFVQDVSGRTGNNVGVFAAYLDVIFVGESASVAGPIEFSTDYPGFRTGTISVGLIDEVGAFAGITPLGSEERLLFSVPATTTGIPGTVTFDADPADVFPAHDTLLYDIDDPIPIEDIEYVGTEFTVVVGQPPVAVADAYTGMEDEVLSRDAAAGVLSNDTDPDADPLTATLASAPQNGSLIFNADGSFEYTPEANFNGEVSFEYIANDGFNQSLPASVTLTIAAVNDAPVAVGETYISEVNQPIAVLDPLEGVLANDSDVEGDQLTATVVRNPEHGNLTLLASGIFSYNPELDFVGTDSFEYEASDGELSSTATVTLIIEGNVAPQTTPDEYVVNEDEILDVPAQTGLLANDVDAEGDPLTAQLVAAPTNGTLTLRADGSFVYEPVANFFGLDAFTYTASDEFGISQPTNVTITVASAPDAPIANSDAYFTPTNQTLSVVAPGVLSNDTDPDGAALTVVDSSSPLFGTVTLNADGSFVYQPAANYTGLDSFTYTITNGELASASASVFINITAAVGENPVGVADGYAVPAGGELSEPAATGVLANDSDPEGGALTAELVSDVANGALTLAADGSFTYVPAPGFVGADTFTYVAVDPTDLQSAETTVTIDVTASGPLVAIRLRATDAAGNVLTSVAVGEDFDLRVFVEDLSAEPRQGVFGAYTDVTFDGSLVGAVGEVRQAADYGNGPGGTIDVNGLIDEAGGFDGLEPLGPAERLLFSVPMQAIAAGTVTFATDPAEFEDVTLFASRDPIPADRVDYGTVSLTIGEFLGPVAANDEYTLDGVRLVVEAADGVLANDAPVEGQSIAASLVTTTPNGVLSLGEDGSFVYTPNLGFVGQDVFSYQAVSGGVNSQVATVTITVLQQLPGSINGFVHFDINNDGQRDGERPIGGAIVTARLPGDDDVLATTRTDRNGFYSFDLPPGEYVIAQGGAAVVVDGIDSVNGLVSRTNDEILVDLTSAGAVREVNFAERGLQPAYFGNPRFFSSAQHQGVTAAVGSDGAQSWYGFEDGWNAFASVEMEVLTPTTVRVTARPLNSNAPALQTTVSTTTNPNVVVLGNATNGYLIRMRGSSAQYFSLAAAAVDEVFAEQ